MSAIVSVIEKDGSCLNGSFELKEDKFLGLCMCFKDYHGEQYTFILDQQTLLKEFLSLDNNILSTYLNSLFQENKKDLDKLRSSKDYFKVDKDTFKYDNLLGGFKELIKIKKFLRSISK